MGCLGIFSQDELDAIARVGQKKHGRIMNRSHPGVGSGPLAYEAGFFGSQATLDI